MQKLDKLRLSRGCAGSEMNIAMKGQQNVAVLEMFFILTIIMSVSQLCRALYSKSTFWKLQKRVLHDVTTGESWQRPHRM